MKSLLIAFSAGDFVFVALMPILANIHVLGSDGTQTEGVITMLLLTRKCRICQYIITRILLIVLL